MEKEVKIGAGLRRTTEQAGLKTHGVSLTLPLLGGEVSVCLLLLLMGGLRRSGLNNTAGLMLKSSCQFLTPYLFN